MSIRIKNVRKRFGAFAALDDVSLDVPPGQLLALLGSSGSGKTTLLRVIAGLEVPDAGTVLYEDEDVTRRAPRERNVGFVFQHYALFRHMSVFENIAFALRVRKRPEAEVRARVAELLRLIRLENLAGRLPSQLSGGQRQRVALARALAARPRLLLLDEPFGALDAKVRQELRRLHDEIGMTSVFVTHDQEEAFEVADRVAVMNKGRVEQVGTPREVFDKPANAFVMDFLGNVNVFHGRVQNGRAHLGDAAFDCPEHAGADGSPAAVYMRPHELEISHVPAVQKVREAAARLSCTNNLHQLGLALHNYEGVNKAFPTSVRPSGVTPLPRVSWTIGTLPFLEQDNLRRDYDLSSNWGAASNLPLTSRPVKIFQCPSAPNGSRLDGDPQTNKWDLVAVTDYAAATGIAAYATNVNPTGALQPGIMQKNTTVRIGDVTDGLSNTLLVVESAGRPQIYRRGVPFGAVPARKTNGGGWCRPASDLEFKSSSPDGSSYPGTCTANCTNGFDYPTYKARGGTKFTRPLASSA